MEPLANREKFGRYELAGVLAHGGMATLYLALHHGIEGFMKVVALKRVLPHLAASRTGVHMFLQEARLAARLDHPNIVTTYELGQVGSDYFISMEYLPGEDLRVMQRRARQQQRSIPVELVAAIVKRCANGLHYAHELRDPDGKPLHLVHRDVSPSNILVTYHGAVKVVDFGIARAQSAGPAPSAFQGKFAHSAPEQLERGPIDRRTDVFCLGIVLWELLTGRRLFRGPDPASTCDAVLRQHIVAPSRVRSDVPAALDSIALRALARDPRDRFQSAAELYEAVDEAELELHLRPTGKALGSWLQDLFGDERAELKLALAQGRSLDQTLDRAASVLGDSTDRDRRGATPSIPPPPEPKEVPRVEISAVTVAEPPRAPTPVLIAPSRPVSGRSEPGELGGPTIDLGPRGSPLPPTPVEVPAVGVIGPGTDFRPRLAWSTGLAGAIAPKPPMLRLSHAHWAPHEVEAVSRRSLTPPRVSIVPPPMPRPALNLEPLRRAVAQAATRPRVWVVPAALALMFALGSLSGIWSGCSL